MDIRLNRIVRAVRQQLGLDVEADPLQSLADDATDQQRAQARFVSVLERLQQAGGNRTTAIVWAAMRAGEAGERVPPALLTGLRHEGWFARRLQAGCPGRPGDVDDRALDEAVRALLEMPRTLWLMSLTLDADTETGVALQFLAWLAGEYAGGLPDVPGQPAPLPDWGGAPLRQVAVPWGDAVVRAGKRTCGPGCPWQTGQACGLFLEPAGTDRCRGCLDADRGSLSADQAERIASRSGLPG